MKFRRREFLAIAPAGALASGALGAGTALAAPCGGGKFHSAQLAARLPVGLGYWEGSDAVDSGTDPFALSADGAPEIEVRDGTQVPRLAAALFDARALPAGDPRFLLGPARVQILGLLTGEQALDRNLPSLALRVASDPARGYVHDAWSFRNDETPSISSPIAIDVPVERTGGLHLTVAVTTSEGEREAVVQLSLGIGPGAKLRRGLYLLSWGPKPVPAWHRLALAAVEPEQPEQEPSRYRLVGRGLDPAPVDGQMLAFTVDFAQTGAAAA